MAKKAPNPCLDCGAADRWLGEIFPEGKLPDGVDKKELISLDVFARMYTAEKTSQEGRKESHPKQASGSSVLRIARSGNMISDFHPGAVPCLVCPECGQLTIVTDPSKIRIV
ncbi:hypothetical protein [Alicyclobacillus sp. SO9]|uniref:hypothetical protein n=1 Tax=Alicyclobacillus sp. SO9 TaxID=2665646 RepID=UPI0018E88746|nr:hypothetical protein [Alicyclobacillus sp. SO9]QQE77647.1 hypothetical protein GI364_17135 [Alicyclobacillus sp. SO9]